MEAGIMLRSLLLMFPVVVWCSVFQPIQQKVFSFATMEWYSVRNLQLVTQGGNVVFKLDEIKPSSDLSEDLFLDFETTKPLLKNYQITYENYIPNPFQVKGGATSAKFFTKNQALRLLPRNTALFRPGSIPGSFTIEFWSYFYQIYEGQSIVEFVGNNLGDESDQNDYGFRIVIQRNRLTYIFENFFWEGNESYTFVVSEDIPVQVNRWEHHAVSFNILDGRLVTWRNGSEQQTIWVTKSRKPRSTILIPRIRDEVHATMVIGQGGYVSLDNFAILSVFKDNYVIQNYRQKPAELVSTVYKMPFLFEIRGVELVSKLSSEPSLLKLAYRVADKPFAPGDTTIPWVYVPEQATNFPQTMKMGRYIQWKVQYFPYEQNETTPLLSSLVLRYTEFAKPVVPRLLAYEAGDQSITISWLPSPEENVVGYEIYYGGRSEEYQGTESSAGPSPIFIPYRVEGRLDPVSYTLTGLSNDQAYFVSLRAVDKWGQRSDFSQEIVAFPSDIKSATRYSVK